MDRTAVLRTGRRAPEERGHIRSLGFPASRCHRRCHCVYVRSCQAANVKQGCAGDLGCQWVNRPKKTVFIRNPSFSRHFFFSNLVLAKVWMSLASGQF